MRGSKVRACVMVASCVASAAPALAQITLLEDWRRVESSAFAQAPFQLNTDFDAALSPVLYAFWPGGVSSSVNIPGATGSGASNQESEATPTLFTAIGDVTARGTRPLTPTSPFGGGSGNSQFWIRFRVDTWVQYEVTGVQGLGARFATHDTGFYFDSGVSNVLGPAVNVQTAVGDVALSGRLRPGIYQFRARALTNQSTGAGRGNIGVGNYDIVVTFAPTAPCPGDFNLSGGVPDIEDVSGFFDAFELGLPSADVNGSGGIPDIDDVVEFLAAFNQPC